jgi:hypothetical protein
MEEKTMEEKTMAKKELTQPPVRFNVGDKVYYEKEKGVVSSANEKYVFVKFVRHGQLQETAQACYPNQLRKDE